MKRICSNCGAEPGKHGRGECDDPTRDGGCLGFSQNAICYHCGCTDSIPPEALVALGIESDGRLSNEKGRP